MDKTVLPFLSDETSFPIRSVASVADLVNVSPIDAPIVVVANDDRGGTYEIATGATADNIAIFDHADNSNLQWKRTDVKMVTGQISAANGTYTVVSEVPKSMIIKSLHAKTDTGTVSVEVEIDAVPVTGLGAVVAAAAGASANATAANTAAASTEITFVLTSNAGSATTVDFTLAYY
jgi:hypothetical protein